MNYTNSCIYCGKNFRDQYKLLYHLQSVHHTTQNILVIQQRPKGNFIKRFGRGFCLGWVFSDLIFRKKLSTISRLILLLTGYYTVRRLVKGGLR